jgi:uncharacterized protein (DUF983 family)
MISYLKNIVLHNCPNCGKGKMFLYPWYNIKRVVEMPEKCAFCGQKTEIEVGFYYGTGYVSYALTVAFMVAMFTTWKVLFGLTFNNNSIFWCMGTTIVLLDVLQPWLMRTSRILWLSWFYKKED